MSRFAFRLPRSLPVRPALAAAALIATAAAVAPAAIPGAAANIVPSGRGHVIDLNLRCAARTAFTAAYTYSRYGPGPHRLVAARWFAYADGRRVRSSRIGMPTARTRGGFRLFSVQRYRSGLGRRCRIVVRFQGATHVRRAGNCLIGIRTHRRFPRSHVQLRLCFTALR